MNLAAIYHRPLSEFAHATGPDKYIFRLRTAKDDLTKVTFGFADRASMEPVLSFSTVSMERVRTDSIFDWYEVELNSSLERIAYYFKLEKDSEIVYYLGDCFEKDLNVGRADYFQLPFNLHANRLVIPEWARDAVVYNIFPDSFATDKGYISKQPESAVYEGEECKSLLGGKVKGITQNLEYIKELGFNCIYLNPLFVASSYHKYDLLDYFHIDPTRGTDEEFKELVNKAHSMGIRVIIDGVFNHVCHKHEFFKDVVKNKKKSKYYDCFYELKDGEVKFPEAGRMPDYTCFAYVPEMPKTNTKNEFIKNYFCKVGEYWIKEFDVDGWRLDVANEVDDDFLRAFRSTVKSAKPDALVIGEVWENANHYINNLALDSAMNYDFRRFASGFIAEGKLDAAEFDARITNLLMRYQKQALPASLNLLDSHDVSRFFSLCRGDIDKMELAVLFQMTFVGMPSVFYGDEAGLLGESEPEYRQAMDFSKSHRLYEIYRKLISFRNLHKQLREDSFETILAEGRVYAYKRGNIVICFNAGNDEGKVELPEGEVLLKKNYVCGILSKGGYVVIGT